MCILYFYTVELVYDSIIVYTLRYIILNVGNLTRTYFPVYLMHNMHAIDRTYVLLIFHFLISMYVSRYYFYVRHAGMQVSVKRQILYSYPNSFTN